MGPANADLVKGLMWMAQSIGAPWLVSAVLAVIASRPYPDQRLLNASFAVLGRCGDADAIAALVRLRRATRDRGDLKQISAALTEAAKRTGVSASELAEQTVADGELDAQRRRRFDVGDSIAVLALDTVGRVSVHWEFNGTRATRVPAQLTADHKPDIAKVRRAAADLKNLVAGERSRLEDLLIGDREWSLEVWRHRYLNHPITSSRARRLIWTVITADRTYGALPNDGGEFMLADGTTIGLAADTRIRCWHPVHAEPAEIQAWRGYIMEHELQQPFKQAFREVYLLTPAEQKTGTYSNRFASHVLRYQQTYALMKERRWGSNYLGDWNSGYSGEAKRDFEPYGLRAVFYHQQVDAEGEHRVEYCTTDQVRSSRARATHCCRSCSPRPSCSPTTNGSPTRRSSTRSTDGPTYGPARRAGRGLGQRPTRPWLWQARNGPLTRSYPASAVVCASEQRKRPGGREASQPRRCRSAVAVS